MSAGKQRLIYYHLIFDHDLPSAGFGDIFVKGLEKTIDNEDLQEAFSIFGNIFSAKVVRDASGKSTGRGFVQFEMEEDAKDAIAKANGTLLKGMKVAVTPFKSSKKVHPCFFEICYDLWQLTEENLARELQFTKIIVGNICEANENDLMNAVR
jgi:RNA recognition motif-containing protein